MRCAGSDSRSGGPKAPPAGANAASTQVGFDGSNGSGSTVHTASALLRRSVATCGWNAPTAAADRPAGSVKLPTRDRKANCTRGNFEALVAGPHGQRVAALVHRDVRLECVIGRLRQRLGRAEPAALGAERALHAQVEPVGAGPHDARALVDRDARLERVVAGGRQDLRDLEGAPPADGKTPRRACWTPSKRDHATSALPRSSNTACGFDAGPCRWRSSRRCRRCRPRVAAPPG